MQEFVSNNDVLQGYNVSLTYKQITSKMMRVIAILEQDKKNVIILANYVFDCPTERRTYERETRLVLTTEKKKRRKLLSVINRLFLTSGTRPMP